MEGGLLQAPGNCHITHCTTATAQTLRRAIKASEHLKQDKKSVSPKVSRTADVDLYIFTSSADLIDEVRQ